MKIEKTNTTFNQNITASPFANAFSVPQRITLPQEKQATNLVKKQNVKKNHIILASVGGTLLLAGLLGRKKISKILSRIFSSENIPPSVNTGSRVITSEATEALTIRKPESLYHLTSLENYNSMLSDGIIKKSRFGDGVFLSNLPDLQNKYSKNDFKGMLNWYAGSSANYAEGGPVSGSGTVVLLKFPISSSSENMLSWRQIRLQGYDNSRVSDSWLKFEDFCATDLQELHQKPLEYLYKNEIPITAVQKCGEVNINRLPASNIVDEFWRSINL